MIAYVAIERLNLTQIPKNQIGHHTLDNAEIARQLSDYSVHFFDHVASTNTVARELINNKSRVPLMVLAKQQSAGKGQLGKTWWSTEGSLTFSLGIPNPRQIDSRFVPLATANIVAKCIEDAIGNRENLRLKWPNDVFLNGLKVAGILIETIKGSELEALIIGIGINVNCSIREASKEIRVRATSLKDETAASVDINRLVVSIANSLFRDIHHTARESILPQYLERSLIKKGAKVLIENRDGTKFSCQFNGIGTSGELLVLQNGKQLHLTSASIIDYSD